MQTADLQTADLQTADLQTADLQTADLQTAGLQTTQHLAESREESVYVPRMEPRVEDARF